MLSTRVCSEYCCNNNIIVCVIKIVEVFLNTAESYTVHILTNGKLSHIFTDDSAADQVTSTVSYIVFTTSQALWQLVSCTCPRPRLLYVAIAYEASTKEAMAILFI